MVVNGRPLKRMKTRVTADLYNDFFTFPAASGPLAEPFRKNVRKFLSRNALPPTPISAHLMAWQVLFRAGNPTDGQDSVVCLDVIEEDVARSGSIYCDQCRVVGWSDHPVCGKRYHFIIKADQNPIGGYHNLCICCGELLHFSDSRCKPYDHVVTEDNTEEWMCHQLEDTANSHHLLHGVVHANGYGHLLRVNGREGGSRILSGCHIMNFWDRLCKMLGVRKVSVIDVSKKLGLEYRLLHAIMKGHPWYGNWGYEFGTGSYGVTWEAYSEAVQTLSSLPLSTCICPGEKRLQDTVAFYQSLHEHELVYMKDLFCFLMSLIQKARKFSARCGYSGSCNMHDGAPGIAISHLWTRGDVERVEGTMIKVLLAVSDSKWVSRRTLKAAVYRWGNGNPHLLEYCLKELDGKAASDDMVVTARTNPTSGAREYRLEPGSAASRVSTASACDLLRCPSADIILGDLRYLYESTLQPHTILLDDVTVAAAAQRLLDCKKFVKDYEKEKILPGIVNEIAVHCQVELADETERVVNSKPPPREIIILPPDATIADLKLESSRAFQEVYLMFHRFQAEELIDYSGVDNSTLVKLLLPRSGGSSQLVVRIRGRCTGKSGVSQYRMERGDENWKVECGCGAMDDDGERMLACDVCSVWQHTRCLGIPDSEPVPARFICCSCRSSTQMIKTDGNCCYGDDSDEVKPAITSGQSALGSCLSSLN